MHIVQHHCVQTTRHFVHTSQLIYKKNLCTGDESQGLKLLHTPRPATRFVATNEVLPHSVIQVWLLKPTNSMVENR